MLSSGLKPSMREPMQPDSNRTTQMTEAIAAHLQTTGPVKWSLVRDQFPEISPATFWRKVKAIRARPTKAEGEGGAQKSAMEKTELLDPASGLAKTLGGFYKYQNQALRMQQLFADAAELKRQSTDKNGNITNLAMYSKSITIRENLLYSEIHLLERHFDLGAMHAFYEKIMDTVGAESPEVRDRIVEALKILNHSRLNKSDAEL